VFWNLIKNHASSRLSAKNPVSQVFWDPTKNRVSPKSALLEAVYVEVLPYFHFLKVFSVFDVQNLKKPRLFYTRQVETEAKLIHP
jgi:hypothetical protein